MKCTCSGPVCSCGAAGVVKDGAGVSVSATMMDGGSPQRIVDYQKMNGVSDSQAIYELRLSDAWKSPSSAVHDAPAFHDDGTNGQGKYEARIRDAWKARPEAI